MSIGLSVVGSGYIANKVLKEIYDTCEIISVYSSNFDTAKKISNKYNAKLCKNYDEILKDPSVDCIYITSPHTTHYQYALRAIYANKNVICEKPAAMNKNQLKVLINASKENKIFFCEIMHFRFSYVFNEIKKIITENQLGNLVSIYADIGFDAYLLPKRKRLLDPNLGGGALLDIGIYIASLVEFIFDDFSVENIRFDIEKNDDNIDISDHIYAEINDIFCEFKCSLKEVLKTEVKLIFDNGEISVPMFYVPKRIVKSENNTCFVTAYEFSYKKQFQINFEEIMNSKIESDYYSHSAMLKTIEIIDSIRNKNGIIYKCEKI